MGDFPLDRREQVFAVAQIGSVEVVVGSGVDRIETQENPVFCPTGGDGELSGDDDGGGLILGGFFGVGVVTNIGWGKDTTFGGLIALLGPLAGDGEIAPVVRIGGFG